MKRLLGLGFISALAAPVMALALVSGPASAAAPPPTTCSAGVPAPTNTYPGTTVVANNFESGTLAGFTVNTGTTGTATIDNSQAHSGSCSAHLHVTTDPGSLANLVTTLPANSNDVYADAWFNITTAGVAGNDVPYFRFFFDTTRFVDIYRYNSNGQIWLRVTSSTGFTYTKLVSGSIALNAWRHVGMHVIANGAASTVEVWVDGTSIFSSNQVNTTATTVTALQLGAEHLTQMGDEYIDDLVIKVGAAAAGGTSGALIPIAPTRFLDTRNTSPVAGGSAVSFQVAGVNGIPANVSAVTFNLTVANPTSFGFVTAYPSGTARPNASNVNYASGQIVPNLVTVPVGSDGKVTLYNQSSGSAQLIADVSGYYLPAAASAPGDFQALAPSRFLDTRNSTAVGPGGTVSFQVGGVNGIPATVSAVTFNLTVANPTSFGFVTAYASGTARPNASNLNYATGQIVPNSVTVPVGADGKVTLYNQSSGTAQLIADVSGYYLAGTATASGTFQPIAPTRFLDTRNSTAVAPNGTVSFQVGGVSGIPATVSAVTFNLTVANPTSFGFVTAYASGTTLPNASNLNYATGQIVPNQVVVPVGADGKVTLYSQSAGTAQLIADVAGYYLP
ncbi:hypothetical protein [Arthrobacter ramosus]|uniref:Uncharacterized protein n=1 Tax=Arthrobacter ramosus TaxID=1672 RepID=A0ABV5Y6I8_ARTRM|nr:hypothetical protein [Arthrobacter ramosus]